MSGCCGFLSFSVVFCWLGGRLETTLYIHFIQRWVKSRRHSSARREDEGEKSGKGTPFFAVSGFVGRGWVCRLWRSVFGGAGSVASFWRCLGVSCLAWHELAYRWWFAICLPLWRLGRRRGAAWWLYIGRGPPRGGGGVSRLPPGVRQNRSTLLCWHSATTSISM